MPGAAANICTHPSSKRTGVFMVHSCNKQASKKQVSGEWVTIALNLLLHYQMKSQQSKAAELQGFRA